MNSNEIRQRFLSYFKSQNHHILESASLITTDQKGITNSTLFNTAGVQPLIPFILSGEHPTGKRLASSQKCVRTIDIDEVGDNTHLTFFEMLGNWSLGDYFKQEAIKMSYEFLTSKEVGLGLDINRLYVTVFAGNEYAEKDEEAHQTWKEIFEQAGLNPEKRIFFLESNWWAAGDNGPCGPDTEMFYDLTESGLGDLSHEEYLQADDKQEVVEIWNNVFMQFEKEDGKVIGKLQKFAVDTGAGLERLTIVINNKKSIFETDIFKDVIELIKNKSTKFDDRSARIIADHIRCAVMLISDGARPANTDRGYVLRKILRRMIRLTDKISMDKSEIYTIINTYVNKLKFAYPDLEKNETEIKSVVEEELNKFIKALSDGLREIEKIKGNISGEDAFKLFSSYGMPIELITEIAHEKGMTVDTETFKQKFEDHQNLSRTSSEGKFKGGLSGHSDIEKRYHTATHLLHQALCDVLGGHVEQKGSNINTERMRFDFSHTEKMTPEQIKKVEDIVNEKISLALPVHRIELPMEEALKTGAKHLFSEKYGDTVSIYFIGDNIENAYSKEFCGGPHVSNTSEIGKFKIAKEESSSQGVRRIKSIVE